MKHRLIFLTLLLSLACAGLQARDSHDIRLLYWNIQNGMWSDQQNNYDNFVAWVRSQDPDICVWCEGASIFKSGTAEKMDQDSRYLPFNWDELAARYGHSYVYVGGWRDNYPQVITSKFPIKNVKRILGDPKDVVVTHGAAWVQLDIQGKTVNIVTLHTWPQKYAYLAQDQKASAAEDGGHKYRRREIEYICNATINSVKDARSQYWMMMGDTNARSRVDSAQYHYPENSAAYLVHDYIRKETPYIDVWARWSDNAFCPTIHGDARIDFIYATPLMYSCIRNTKIYPAEGWVKSVRDPQKLSNFYHPSDHMPILVDFNLSGEWDPQQLSFDWKDLGNGAQYACLEGEVFGAPQHIAVVRYPARKFKTEVVNDSGLKTPKKPEYPAAVDPENPATTTSGFAQRYGAAIAMNGGYFNMKTLYPTTYVRDNGAQEGVTTPDELFRVDGLVAFSGHKIEFTDIKDTLQYNATLKNWPEALAAGPMLIKDGVARSNWPESSFYMARHPRSVIGTRDGWVYLIDIDGRFHGTAEGATIAETVEIARQLGLRNALNLDGGGSSTLWTGQTGVLSHPNDNDKWDHAGERVVPNAIIAR